MLMTYVMVKLPINGYVLMKGSKTPGRFIGKFSLLSSVT